MRPFLEALLSLVINLSVLIMLLWYHPAVPFAVGLDLKSEARY